MFTSFNTKEFYIMSACSKYDFCNYKRALKLKYVVNIQNSMPTCDNLKHFMNENKICF